MLKDKRKHHFSVELATIYGLEEAVFLSNLFFWSGNNLLTNRNVEKGKVWIKLSRAKIQEYHPYFSTGIIRSITKKLKEHDLIETTRGKNYLSYTLTSKGWLYCLELIEQDEKRTKVKMKLQNIRRIDSPINDQEELINSLSEKISTNSLLNTKIKKVYTNSNKFLNHIFNLYLDNYSSKEINLAMEKTIEAYREIHESPLANVSKYLLSFR